jgi:glycosyltransferase involved in cell wall biosynthesis
VTTVKLSILIPSLYRRRAEFATLLGELSRQIGDSEVNGEQPLPVEVLTVIDGGQLSVGEKRNKLLHAASGDYVAFVDDDDSVSGNYIDELLHAIVEGEARQAAVNQPPDVITFEVEYTDVSQKSRTLFIQSLKYRDGRVEYTRQRIGAPPTHVACWRRKVALCNEFPPISYAEDWLWWQPLLQSGLVKSEIHIDWPLYHYRFNRLVTGTQKREKREEALKWAGPEGVAFYGGGGFLIKRYTTEERAANMKYIEFNRVPLICTCHIT